jgi:hypothetical protein
MSTNRTTKGARQMPKAAPQQETVPTDGNGPTPDLGESR